MGIAVFRLIARFSEVSLTGPHCALNCHHCRGKYLRHMLKPLPGSNGLYRLLEQLRQKGVRGVLLSGGLTREGLLPITENVVEQIWVAKRRLGMVFNLHPGFERRLDLLEQLVGAVDTLDYEFSLSREIVKGVRRLPIKPRDTAKILETLLEIGFDVVPHIFLWHPWGSSQLLREELRVADELGARMVTLLVYIPPPGDPKPDPARLVELLRLARSWWPRELSLGCMRPYDVKRVLDRAAIEEGLVDRIANPHQEVLRSYLDSVRAYDACCSLPEHVLGEFRIEPSQLLAPPRSLVRITLV
ncbi:hypothetical protein [Hyperthermus butylicus]|uniref:Uncharacterized protein n=1 Tax=Hyperthermus butylicus (strain DSM 5456 / JCM 9403 / PLM1-5) TaxID=415426 RepID=A2BK59_HYPBU|nr:hypothetical protein [Hyperthermus butylicus]ABM80370.1 hypothetical protein Hbut_0508 [Hyperthermus butylicus DSM 5456]